MRRCFVTFRILPCLTRVMINNNRYNYIIFFNKSALKLEVFRSFSVNYDKKKKNVVHRTDTDDLLLFFCELFYDVF